MMRQIAAKALPASGYLVELAIVKGDPAVHTGGEFQVVAATRAARPACPDKRCKRAEHAIGDFQIVI
jgi:hypothetical protein